MAAGIRHDRKGKGDHNHLVLLAENNVGYKNLIRLVTQAHLEGFYYSPRVDQELLAGTHAGLIALSSCLHGKVSQRLSTMTPKAPRPRPGNMTEIFPGRFYLEVQANELPEQHKVNEALLELAPQLGPPPGGHQRLPLPEARGCPGP